MLKFKTNFFSYQNLFFHSNEVVSIVFRGKESGEITILYDHSPLIVALENIVLKCRFSSGAVKNFQIKKGVFSFHNNVANIMCSDVELKTKIKT